MTLQTWMAEFYPFPASDILKFEHCGVGWAIEHARLKYQGALPKNLEKHNCHLKDGYVWGRRDYFDYMNGNSCAFCRQWPCDTVARPGDSIAESCPVFLFLGKKCDPLLRRFRGTGNPQPILDKLDEMEKWHEEKDKG